MAYLGALEAGGTKMVCAVGREDGSVVEQVSIPTTEPSRCMPQILEFFRGKDMRGERRERGALRARAGDVT